VGLVDDQNSVSPALAQLFDDFIPLKNSFNIVFPAVKVHYKIDPIACLKALWNKNGHRTIRVMFFRGKDLVLVAIALRPGADVEMVRS